MRFYRPFFLTGRRGSVLPGAAAQTTASAARAGATPTLQVATVYGSLFSGSEAKRKETILILETNSNIMSLLLNININY